MLLRSSSDEPGERDRRQRRGRAGDEERLLKRQRHDPDGDGERDAECADERGRVAPDGAAAIYSVTTHGRRCRRKTGIPAGVAPDRSTTDTLN